MRSDPYNSSRVRRWKTIHDLVGYIAVMKRPSEKQERTMLRSNGAEPKWTDVSHVADRVVSTWKHSVSGQRKARVDHGNYSDDDVAAAAVAAVACFER